MPVFVVNLSDPETKSDVCNCQSCQWRREIEGLIGSIRQKHRQAEQPQRPEPKQETADTAAAKAPDGCGPTCGCGAAAKLDTIRRILEA